MERLDGFVVRTTVPPELHAADGKEIGHSDFKLGNLNILPGTPTRSPISPGRWCGGPTPATQRMQTRLGLAADGVDLFEISEELASVPLAWQTELGASGARLLTTLLHELERSGKEIGLVALCCGGGIGTGTVIRRI